LDKKDTFYDHIDDTLDINYEDPMTLA